MVKHGKSRHKNDDKKKTIVNLGKVGGIGGVIFLGGVLVTGIVTSFLAVRRRRTQKSICDKNNNPKTSASLHSFDSEEETKGLQLIVSKCCPKENHQLSNRKTAAGLTHSSSVTCLISTEDDHNKGNHEESAKNDDGNLRDLEDEKEQMDEGEKTSSSSADEDHHEISIAQSGILDRNQHYDDGDISTRIEIDETFDSSSTEANIAADDLIEKTSEENNTCEGNNEIHEISEEAEGNSEGTLDSSAESNSEAIWPTETIQEMGMAHKARPDKDSIENTSVEVPIKQMNHNEEDKFNLIFGIRNESRTRFVDRYNLHLNEMKWRILFGTLLALLLHQCFRFNVLAS